MSRFPGFPLYDAASHLEEQMDADGYRAVMEALAAVPLEQDDIDRDYRVTFTYLEDFTSVPGTYNRFRSEVQRFLNYLWLVAGRTLDQVDSEVVASYFKFLKNPPASWIAPSIAHGFIDKQGERVINPRWRPFTDQKSKGTRYTPSPASLKASRTALSSYFRFLLLRKVLAEDPLLQVRRRDTLAKSKALIEHSEDSVRRYSDWQWSFIRDALEKVANENPMYERHLFVVITMKTLFLRFSELAVRSVDGELRTPRFSDFRKQVIRGEEVWTYYVFGKGEKGRSITCPDAYLDYLKRWRAHLGCDTPLPLPNDSTPILSSRKGGGLFPRQVHRICEEALLLAADAMEAEGFLDESKELRAISAETHYLRHTGASQAIDAGADIRHISEELGHASAAFTEQVYVNADQNRRRVEGRDRAI
ncbi:MAG: phage integrase family protein [Marinobacter sp. T13-3]|nr:MAG: phage integrase family protein [Marinobacter sp. T13-3]